MTEVRLMPVFDICLWDLVCLPDFSSDFGFSRLTCSYSAHIRHARDLTAVPALGWCGNASSSFRERDAAQAEKPSGGSAVADAAELGLASEDREVERRARIYCGGSKMRPRCGRRCSPHPIRLRHEQTLLSTTFLDIGDRTGLQIVALPALSGRRVSDDTGELPFWQAWERLCKEDLLL